MENDNPIPIPPSSIGGDGFKKNEILGFIQDHNSDLSSIVGIGCDLVEIARFQTAVLRQGDPFLRRLFTQRELNECSSTSNPIPSYAARFAAKEALAKALGCGIGNLLSWHDMEIVKDERGKPEVVWSSTAQQKHGPLLTYITLSHSQTHAMAFAVVRRSM